MRSNGLLTFLLEMLQEWYEPPHLPRIFSDDGEAVLQQDPFETGAFRRHLRVDDLLSSSGTKSVDSAIDPLRFPHRSPGESFYLGGTIYDDKSYLKPSTSIRSVLNKVGRREVVHCDSQITLIAQPYVSQLFHPDLTHRNWLD